MAVCIRLSRFGRLHRPYFRIVAIDGRCHREGKANEILGSYDPQKADKNIEVDMSRVESWVNRGAQISDGLKALLRFQGYQVPTPKTTAAKKPAKPAAKTAKSAAKPAGKKGEKQPWIAPTRRALRKHAAKLKVEHKAKLAAAEAAKKAAEPAAAPAADAAPKA